MGNDIFADYIKNLKQNNESARPAVPYAVGRENVSAGGGSETLDVLKAVSYTHLDVYKRQVMKSHALRLCYMRKRL